MARRRRRRTRRKTRRRSNPSILRGRLGNFGKLVSVAVGYAASQAPLLDQRPMDNIPVSYAGILGGALFLTRMGRGDAIKFAGLGMLLGGGVQEFASDTLAPIFNSPALSGGQ